MDCGAVSQFFEEKAKRAARRNCLTAHGSRFFTTIYSRKRLSRIACLTKTPTERVPAAITDMVARRVQIIANQLHMANTINLKPKP